jgi:predicted nucleic acid-binding protein
VSTLLDTNILTCLAHPDHPRHIVARDAVRFLLERAEEVCVVPQNLYEFWVVATRPAAQNGLGMSLDQAQAECSQIKRLFTLFRDERGILGEWERLVAQHAVMGKTGHDARLVAAMHRHGLTHLLTFNAEHFARFPGITIATPEDVLQGAR